MAGSQRLRAVLDTSVLLSAERRSLLFLAANGAYTIVIGDYIAGAAQRFQRATRAGIRALRCISN